MSRRPIRKKEILDPSRVLNNLLKDYVDGRLSSARVLYRAVVIQVDNIGGQFVDEETPNPKGSVKARVISDALDMYTANEDLSVFWPMFSHDYFPVKEGEHIYVIFEDQDTKSHGLWISRLPESLDFDSINFTDGTSKYQAFAENDNRVSDIGLQNAVQDTVVDLDPIALSPDFIVEPTATRVEPKTGDRIIQGSNSNAVILSVDPISQTESSCIDIVTGFSGTLNFETDKSRIYVTMKTNLDDNLSLSSDYSSVQPGPPVNNTSAIILKSDEIRIVARTGMKVVVEGGDLHLEGANIFLGKDAAESLMKGDAFKTLWSEILTLLSSHVHPSPIPNSPSPTLASLGTPAKNDLSNPSTGPVLSQTVKVKS